MSARSARKQAASPRVPAAAAKRRNRGYGGRDASERQGERKGRLLDAGLNLFCARGYAATRIEQVCTEARVSTRQFYETFPDRESLLAELLETITDQTQREVMQALREPAADRTSQVLVALQAFIRYYLEDPRRARLACIEAVGVSAEMERRRRRIIHEWARLIEAHTLMLASRGELPAGDYHLVSVALVGAVNEVMIDCISAEPPVAIAVAQDTLLGMFRSLISGARLGNASAQ